MTTFHPPLQQKRKVKMEKYKLIIFETNRKDGCMSKSKKFYPSDFTEQEIIERLNKVRENIEKNIILMVIIFCNLNKKM